VPKQRQILVTGASGFVGLHLVRRLLAQGESVTTLCRHRDQSLEALSGQYDNLQNRQGDLLQMDMSTLGALTAPFDIVYHLAGLVSYQKRDIEKQRQVNVEGTRKLASALAKSPSRPRLIHTSSIAGMGVPEVDGGFADESLVYNLSGLGLGYCDSKQESENVVLELVKAEGLDAVILSPGIIFGEGDKHAHHFRIFRQMASGKAMFVPRGGIPFSDINDVVVAHLNAPAMARKGERYCLVSANKSFKEAAETFMQLSGQRPRKLYEFPEVMVLFAGLLSENLLTPLGFKDGLSWQQAWLANKKIFFKSDKAVAELGFKATPFTEMVARTTPYYLGSP
jgi:dihydroflavonol-4-reductase